jgi:hypothetical protein
VPELWSESEFARWQLCGACDVVAGTFFASKFGAQRVLLDTKLEYSVSIFHIRFQIQNRTPLCRCQCCYFKKNTCFAASQKISPRTEDSKRTGAPLTESLKATPDSAVSISQIVLCELKS